MHWKAPCNSSASGKWQEMHNLWIIGIKVLTLLLLCISAWCAPVKSWKPMQAKVKKIHFCICLVIHKCHFPYYCMESFNYIVHKVSLFTRVYSTLPELFMITFLSNNPTRKRQSILIMVIESAKRYIMGA